MPKVLLVAHWDWVLYNFRLPLAKVLREVGYDVEFVCPFGEYVDKLISAGFRCIHWSVIRKSLNPIREIVSILYLARIYRQERPALVHHFTVKPNFYGSLAARLTIANGQRLKVINTFSGLGFLFSSNTTATMLRTILLPVMKAVLRSKDIWTVCLNVEDREVLVEKNLANSERIIVISRDGGIDTALFSPNGDATHINSRKKHPVVLMASRLLWDKGVKEFVEAAKLLRQRGVDVEFWLAGAPDSGNPMYVPEKFVRQWHESGLIRWLGHCEDMPNLLRQADIAVLPSYHEGLPRFLLEAAATGLPLVATDIKGCRMVVRHGENGFLVPIRDAKALAGAIETLVRNPQLRLRMGKTSREIAIKQFDERNILEQWLSYYWHILKDVKMS